LLPGIIKKGGGEKLRIRGRKAQRRMGQRAGERRVRGKAPTASDQSAGPGFCK
jgi:hypothetical protein